MKKLSEMSRSELGAFYDEQKTLYEEIKAKGYKLDMSRGKPAKAQLDLSNELFNLPTAADIGSDGTDERNYGVLDGIPSCRKLFADILGVDMSEVFAAGSASLTLMYDTIAKAYTHGLLHSEKPWSKLERVKFLCPAPGYDRHFSICKTFGMEMITIPMTATGPDMDMVEEYVKDPDVRGMWCVPKYSNPDGIIYSMETVERIASLKCAAPDFVLMWDNAYCVHEFEGEFVEFPNILEECRKHGNPDMVFEYASTSKITFPGAGVSCFATSRANLDYMKKLMGVQMISFDKINQLRHVLFLKDRAHTLEHMKKHAAIMAPKFKAVVDILSRELTPLGVATFNEPKGGYFVSLFTMNGCAKRVHALMKEAGIVMTGAGATYPNGVDPNDANLRIAPSLPPLENVCQAMEALAVCVKLASAEKLLG